MNRNEIKGPCRTRVLTFTPSFGFNWLTESVDRIDRKSKERKEVPPRFELGLQDSESWVLTITPWDHYQNSIPSLYQHSLQQTLQHKRTNQFSEFATIESNIPITENTFCCISISTSKHCFNFNSWESINELFPTSSAYKSTHQQITTTTPNNNVATVTRVLVYKGSEI